MEKAVTISWSSQEFVLCPIDVNNPGHVCRQKVGGDYQQDQDENLTFSRFDESATEINLYWNLDGLLK